MRGQRHAPAVFTPGKDPVPIVQEAGWAPGPVWTGAENLGTFLKVYCKTQLKRYNNKESPFLGFMLRSIMRNIFASTAVARRNGILII